MQALLLEQRGGIASRSAFCTSIAGYAFLLRSHSVTEQECFAMFQTREATLLDAHGFTVCVRHKLLECGKEFVVISDLRRRVSDPWRRQQSHKNVAFKKLFHFDFELLTEGAPIPIVFRVSEQCRH